MPPIELYTIDFNSGGFMERFYRYLCECIFIAIFAFVIFNNKSVSYGIDEVPLYNGEPYVVIDNNEPSFSELISNSFELYSDLDSLGRVGVAFALVSKSTMPTTKRGSIGMIKPAGWHTVKYDFVDGKYSGVGKYNSPIEFLKAVKDSGIELVSLAHNHVLDYGYQGLETTISKIKEQNVEITGIKTAVKKAEKAEKVEA